MFPSKYLWIGVSVLFAIDAAWLTYSDFTLVWSSFLPVLVGLVALVGLAAFYTYRRPDSGIATLLKAMIFITVLTNLAAIFSYLITSLNLPLLDAQFAAADAAIMFDWPGFLSAVNDHPLIGWTLTWAYRSSLPQVLVVILLLGFSQRDARMVEFLTLYTVTMVVIVTMAGLMPSEGAYAYHLPATETFSNLNPIAGMWHHVQFTGLRDGSLRAISLSEIEGLVTFPSFHTALAIVTAYCMRGIPIVFPIALMLNALVVISTLSEGGHYLVDVIAGAAITAFAIFAYRALSATEKQGSRTGLRMRDIERARELAHVNAD